MRWAFFIAVAALCSATTSVAATQPMPDWTVLIYLNANNNLEPFAVDNYLQMEKIGSTDRVKVVVEFARLGKDARYNWHGTLRFLVQQQKDPLTVNAVQNLGVQDMGSGATFENFLSWGTKTYPASHYMVVVWDHGQGWRLYELLTQKLSAQRLALIESRREQVVERSVKNADLKIAPTLAIHAEQSIPNPVRSASYDENTGHMLYNRQIADAVRSVFSEKRLDIISFDACMMAMIETAYAFHDAADVLVGSEELEPGPGWNYTKFLGALVAAPTSSSNAVGRIVVDAYAASYSKSYPGATMSAVDISKTVLLASKISSLSTLLQVHLPTEAQEIRAARNSCGTYGATYGFHGVDISCFDLAIAKSTPDSTLRRLARQVDLLVHDAVIATYATEDRTTSYTSRGLAIYFPENDSLFQADADHDGYVKASANAPGALYPVEFVQKNGWPDFLASYLAANPN